MVECRVIVPEECLQTILVERLRGVAYKLYGAQEGLLNILHRCPDRGDIGDGLADLGQRLDISLLGQGVLLGPALERLLLGLLLGLDVQTLQSARHADRVLPVVRRAGIFRGVLDTHLVAGIHIAAHDILTQAADIDTLRVVHLERLVDLVRGHVTLGRAREAHDHGEVTLAHAVERDLQMARSLVGAVVLRVVGGAVVLVGIDAEYREVARVAGPHPVVGVAAELAYRRGGRAHKTYVAEDLHHKGEILVAAEEGQDLYAHALVLGLKFLLQGRDVLGNDLGALLLARDRGYVAQNLRRHILDAAHETHRKTRYGKLLVV